MHVNAHATSTPAGDGAEAKWIAELLGEQTMVSATKSMTGHLLGAAGAIEAIATVLAVHNDIVPPTINLDDPDDEVRVDVPREARKMPRARGAQRLVRLRRPQHRTAVPEGLNGRST